MPEYTPDPIDAVKDLQELLSYLVREQQKISAAMATIGTQQYPELSKEPSRRSGTIAFADGTNWNPGSGRGFYAFFNNSWNPMFPTVTHIPDPPEEPETPTDPVEPPTPEDPVWMKSFENTPTDDGFFQLQAASSSRAVLVTPAAGARLGTKAVQLTTMGSDTNIQGSGANERCDLTLNVEGTQNDGVRGRQQWWAWSMMLPDNFQMVNVNSFWYVLMQYHGRQGGYSPTVALYVENRDPTGAHFVWKVRGGPDGKKTEVNLFGNALPQKNVWYDFVAFMKWDWEHAQAQTKLWGRIGNAAQYDLLSDLSAGTQANMYPNQTWYLKPSNYHSNTGTPSSVIYDRIGYGTTPYSVAMAPLAGVPL